jgi:hypothetical protein
VQDLFEEPDFSVSSIELGHSSGISQLIDKVRSMRRGPRTPVAYDIRIDDKGGASKEVIYSALRTYCNNKISENSTEIRLMKHEGWVYLLWSLIGVILLALVLGGLSIIFPDAIKNDVIKFVFEIFVVAAWVVLWMPIELILYDWRPLQRENDEYNSILNSSVVIT